MVRASALGGLGVGSLTWLTWLLDRDAWPGVALPVAVTALAVLNVALTSLRPDLKVAAVRTLQRCAVNPVVHALARVGINPLGVTLLRTRGRRSGLWRTTPVGTARAGETVWLVAEHGERAGYVRNIRVDPRIQVRLREQGRPTWRDGLAQPVPTDDPLLRQRRMAGLNPIRWLNVIMVRFLGAELLSVRVDLEPSPGSFEEAASQEGASARSQKRLIVTSTGSPATSRCHRSSGSA